MANIYLHYILDRWFEGVIKAGCRGYCFLIRYADDFIVGFQYREEAEAFAEKLKIRLGKYGLRISEAKSKIIDFGRKAWLKSKISGLKVESFDFLGFTFYCDTSRRGYFKISVKTSRKKFVQKLKAMNDWLKQFRNKLPLLGGYWEKLKQKLRGHYEYYGLSGNFRGLKRFYERTVILAWKWINRRSDSRSYNWKQFNNFLKYNPPPKPRITHSLY